MTTMRLLTAGILLTTGLAWAVTSPRPIHPSDHHSSNAQSSQSQTQDHNQAGGNMMVGGGSYHVYQGASSSSQSSSKQKGSSKSQSHSKSQTVTTQHPVAKFKLRSNPSTGFTWYIKHYPHNLVEIKSHQMKRPSKDQHKVGVPGYEIWQFKAKKAAFTAPHVIPIKMMYARPWMAHGDNSQTRTLYIVTH